MLVQFWAFFEEMISKVSLQNCNKAYKAHRASGWKAATTQRLCGVDHCNEQSLGAREDQVSEKPEGGLDSKWPC